MSWRKVKLGEVLTESKIICENPNTDRRIKVKLKVLGVEKRGVENEIEGATKQFIRKTGQFIYGKQNFHKGAFGIIPKELDGFESSADLPAFDVSENCLPEWIFYFFKQGNYFLELAKIARGVATQRIHPEQIFNIEIPLPEIKIQKQILSNIKLLENNGANISKELSFQLTLVKKLRQQFLQDAVQGKLVEQNQNDEPASELLKKIKSEKSKLIKEGKLKKEKELPPIKDEEIPFKIPDNWVWCRLGEIIYDTEGGKSPNCLHEQTHGNEWGVIKTTAVQEMAFLENENKVLPKNFLICEQHKVIEGDILITRAGPKNRVGIVCCVEKLTKKLILSDKTIRIKHSKELLFSKFISMTLNSPLIKPFIELKMTGMADSQVNISQENMKGFPIPLPPFKEQTRIVQKLEQLMQTCNKLEESIKQSAAQNEKLLQQVLREALRQREELENECIIKTQVYQEKEEKYFVKRKVLATYIINQSLDDKRFGDVKFEKLLHLSEYFAIKRNLGQNYYQKAAGPFDNAFTFQYFNQVIKDKWFKKIKNGNQFVFLAGQNHNKSKNTYNYFSEDEFIRVNKLINYFKKYDYEQPEIISTLYAVWNNRVILQQEFADDCLINDFYNWDENKIKYDRIRLKKAIQWMRDENLIPDGWGKLIEKPKKK